MLIALISDIHANELALEACLAQAARLGAERLVFLGDLIGYGARPEPVVRRVMQHVKQGAIVLLGNHDSAIAAPDSAMNEYAARAIAWTRTQLSDEARQFLFHLPLEHREVDRLYVHADASAPARWRYVTDSETARASLMATDARITFCGHVHVPQLYCISEAGKLIAHKPVTNVPIVLSEHRRWLVVMGAVGQPRDGNPAAAFATFDTETRTLTYRRAPYDIETVVDQVRAAGLPDMLAVRLLVGR